MDGVFSLVAHPGRDLAGYYASLAVHKGHNYYQGRAKADLTSWIEYFTVLLAKVFTQAKNEAITYLKTGVPSEPEKLRQLDHRARIMLSLFAGKDKITSMDVAQALGLSSRMVRIMLRKWVEDGWLLVTDTANRSRSYGLSAIYRQFSGKVTIAPDIAHTSCKL